MGAKHSSLSGWELRRLHPKLRMALNADPPVNACRAESAGFLRVTSDIAQSVPVLASASLATRVPADKLAVKDLDRAAPREAVLVSVFVQTTDSRKLAGERQREGNFAVLDVPLDDLPSLVRRGGVSFIEQAETLKAPTPMRLATAANLPADRFATINHEKQHRFGEDVLIGIIDVEGFDWMHPDFDDGAGRSRFISIWDQGRKTGAPPAGFVKGVEITRAAMDKARADAPGIGVSPHDLEPQSQMVAGSHGTHVASIAAGVSGLCRKAKIAAVLVSAPPGDRRTSFYDSSLLLDAVKYLIDLAEHEKKPISINISLGTNGHAHDGSSVIDRWIDQLIAKPGRSICVAAGNAGQERAEAPDDLGYILGRIHTGGQIAAAGLDHDIEWIVGGDTVIDVSENELEFWYEPQDRVAVSIKPPGGKWIGPVRPGEYLENMQLPDKTMLSIYNELYHPANGNNYISIYLTPFWREKIVGIQAGQWLVRLHGLEIRDGRFHGWIERDDPQFLESGQQFWPSFFSPRSNVDMNSVSSLACGARIVSVANLDEARDRINISSSQGPTRDGRQKPDVAAPGTEIWAANGFGDPKQPWVAMTGTSMASPFVAGVVGLMLAANNRLGAAQVNGILKATARPLPGGNFQWINDGGFGVIHPAACVEQALQSTRRTDIKERFE
jgi:subtilisin family serine protease